MKQACASLLVLSVASLCLTACKPAARKAVIPKPTPAAAAVRPPPGNEAVPTNVLAVPPAVAQLKIKDKLLLVRSGPNGALYTVKSSANEVLAEDLSAEQVASKFPDLKGVVERGVADWAGNAED